MAGRGRGRGNLGRWGPSPGSGYTSEYDGRAVASVPPLKKELPLSLPTDSNSTNNETRICCVRVTCIIDVNHFWAQLGSDSELEHFDNYMFALNHWCDNQIAAPLNEMPGVGQVVCVKHAASATWRRAEVTRLCQRMVDVFFLDFGEAECVDLEMLCGSVPGDITSWPPQALYCTLEGVQPPMGEDQWSEKAVKRFTELVTCGQALSASHEAGSFQLTLYLSDDMGQLRSVGSILAEEGLAQETKGHNLSNEEALWHEESPRQQRQQQHQHGRRTIDKPDLKSLDKLEQQLVMSGFSYLIPNKSEEPEGKPPKGYSFERTTISSSYYTYKEKDDDQHGLSSNNDQEPSTLASQYHSSFKHFHSPITQVLPSSNSLPSFTPIREGPRNHQAGYGSHHLSTRPHLASPGEFMSSSKGHSQVKNQEHGSALSEEKPSRYIPPPLRTNQGEGENTMSSTDVTNQSSWYNNSCSLVNNTWSPSEQVFPSWPVQSEDEMRKDTQYGLNEDYVNESQLLEDRGPPQQTDISYQKAQDAAAILQHHLEGPSAFHDPKNNQHSFPAPFNQPVKNDKGLASQLQASALRQQHPVRNQLQFQKSKSQSLSENEQMMKKELSWHKWKFQRNVKRVLEKVKSENVDGMSYELGTLISESKLSQNFEGVSEVMLVLEMIVEKVLDKKGFAHSASKICHLLSGLEISRFSNYLCKVITTFRDDIVQHHTISDWKHRCQRFCKFIGEMILSVYLNEDDLGNSFKTAVSTLVNQSLEKWSSLEQDKSETEQNVFVVCLVSLLRVIGPTLEEGNTRLGDIDIDQIFNVVRNQVLSTDLPRSVRNDLLDLMLLRAAGWPNDPQETDNDSGDDGSDGVVVEQDGSQEDDSSPSDEVLEDWSQNDEDWDPYARVHAMLQKLKLEDLFEKFKDNCIRDSLLVANKEDLKKTLQEAGFAPGVILEIRMYLEKGDLRVTTRNLNESKSNESRISTKEGLGPVEGQNTCTTGQVQQKEQPARRNDATLEKTMKLDEEKRNRVDHHKSELEEQKNQNEDLADQGINHTLTSERCSAFDPNESSNSHHSSKADRRRTTLEHTTEDNKPGLIDSHNLFEPSYLNRTLPLKVDTTTYEYEAGPESPGNQGPKSYSAVVKSKNEEHSPEATTKSLPVKLTSLTKAASSDGSKDVYQISNKPGNQGKNTPKEASKDTPGKRDQGSSSSRPPPGFPPLPPQNWGQNPELRLTVLNSRQRGRSEDGGPSGSTEGDQNAWNRRQGFGTPDGRGMRNREGGGMNRGGSIGSRGGTATRGRFDQRWKGGSEDIHSTSQNWQGRTVSVSSNWRQRTETKPQDEQNNTRNKIPDRDSSSFGSTTTSDRKTDNASGMRYGGGFSHDATEPPIRPFGVGGPKACFNCGSKDHFTCNDRSKMFFE